MKNGIKNVFSVLAAVLVTSCSAFPSYAVDVTKNVNLKLKDSQIEHGIFSNDIWRTGYLDLGDPVLLGKGESLIINWTFDGSVDLDDGFFNGNESIHIKVVGAAGPGAGFNNKGVDYELEFTGVEGGPFLPDGNKVKGNTSWVPTNGNVNLARDIDLINGGKVSFKDLHLKLTNVEPNGSVWALGKVSVGVDADDITVTVPPKPVPEPSSMLMGLLGIGSILGLRRKPMTA